MKQKSIMAAAIVLWPVSAFAWGQEGHSIVAEIAQRHLAREAPAVMSRVQSVLEPGTSLASIASWADAYRDEDSGTFNWHFADIPIGNDRYDAMVECMRTNKGDCIVAELDRLRNDIRCKKGDEQRMALMFAVHFIGDIHQPLHTVADAVGGNTIDVVAFMHGARCKIDCRMSKVDTNLHVVWDTTLITMTTWDWGSYVTRLERGWLAGPGARIPGIDGGRPDQWADATRKVAQDVWRLTPSHRILDETYYETVLPVLDQQLGLAGLRLARFLEDAFGSDLCPVP
jgi:S1/P1 Nuclease